MRLLPFFTLISPLFILALTGYGRQNQAPAIDQKASAILPKLIEWRRHIHQNPELSNREFKTA
jgi:amidohydrolase